MLKCPLLRNYKYDYSQTVHECSLDGPLEIYVFCSDMKFKMAATAELSLTLVMYSLALIIFVVSEKNAFEHFPIGFNVNLFTAVTAILDFRWT
jgi:hypothetical protein